MGRDRHTATHRFFKERAKATCWGERGHGALATGCPSRGQGQESANQVASPQPATSEHRERSVARRAWPREPLRTPRPPGHGSASQRTTDKRNPACFTETSLNLPRPSGRAETPATPACSVHTAPLGPRERPTGARREAWRPTLGVCGLYLLTPLRNSKSFCPSGMENTLITVPCDREKRKEKRISAA